STLPRRPGRGVAQWYRRAPSPPPCASCALVPGVGAEPALDEGDEREAVPGGLCHVEQAELLVSDLAVPELEQVPLERVEGQVPVVAAHEVQALVLLRPKPGDLGDAQQGERVHASHLCQLLTLLPSGGGGDAHLPASTGSTCPNPLV